MLNAEKVNKKTSYNYGEYGFEVSTLDRKSKDYEGRWSLWKIMMNGYLFEVYHLLLYVENWIDFFNFDGK